MFYELAARSKSDRIVCPIDGFCRQRVPMSKQRERWTATRRIASDASIANRAKPGIPASARRCLCGPRRNARRPSSHRGVGQGVVAVDGEAAGDLGAVVVELEAATGESSAEDFARRLPLFATTRFGLKLAPAEAPDSADGEVGFIDDDVPNRRPRTRLRCDGDAGEEVSKEGQVQAEAPCWSQFTRTGRGNEQEYRHTATKIGSCLPGAALSN
jgi:hypothetical protein